jgi:hypothetical protein
MAAGNMQFDATAARRRDEIGGNQPGAGTHCRACARQKPRVNPKPR